MKGEIMKSFFKCYRCLFFLLFSYGTGTAQDSLTTYQRNEIVVTATRSEKNPAEIGRSITLLTKDQIKNSLFNSVGELISGQGGMYIVGAGQNPGSGRSAN